jgi:alanine racemase
VSRGAVAEIDLGALAYNLGAARRIAGGRPVIAVVKADAYGHGAVKVSAALEKQRVHSLATAFVSEAVELREAGIKAPILVLFEGAGMDKTVMEQYFKYSLTPAIHDVKSAASLSKEAAKRGEKLDVHIKVDTGMGRMGLEGRDCIKSLLEISSCGNLRIKGLMSHFSEADLEDISYAKTQLKRFNEARSVLAKIGHKPLCHIANSAAALSFKDSHLDAIRPGLMLYGCLPFKNSKASKMPALKPVMTVKTKILAIRRLGSGKPVSYGRTFITTRETLVGVLPVGYADGLSRALSNNSDVVIRGRRAPVIGRVCMDLTMVDVTDIKGARAGDDALILGGNIKAWELAERSSTIPYEVFTSLGMRSKRAYKG